MSNKQIRKSGPVQLPVSFLRGGAAAASPLSLFILTSFLLFIWLKSRAGGVLFLQQR